MKKTLCIVLVCVVLAGCASAVGLRNENRKNITRLSVGMPKEQVSAIMGDITCWNMGLTITNPYRSEIYETAQGPIEVLYYYTDVVKTDIMVAEEELTPLVFEQGRLTGWGRDFLVAIKKKNGLAQ